MPISHPAKPRILRWVDLASNLGPQWRCSLPMAANERSNTNSSAVDIGSETRMDEPAVNCQNLADHIVA